MKNARHQQILLLIRQYDIETQEELADLLNRTGFAVTQATVSRDIRQLQLQKVHLENGRQNYEQSAEENIDLSRRYKRVLKDAFVSMDVSENIVVIRTISGMAMAAAAALDSLDWRELIGCIAGDDTIMCVLRTREDGENFLARVNELLR